LKFDIGVGKNFPNFRHRSPDCSISFPRLL